MGSININGKIYSGDIIIVSGNKVVIDGKEIKEESKVMNITIDGNIDTLSVDACEKISVTGSVENLKTMSGDVEVTGDVNGSIKTMSGDIRCKYCCGSVQTLSGDIYTEKQ